MALSLPSRKRDKAYFLYFSLHIPIMFLVDLYPLYSTFSLQTPTFMTELRNWYINTYADAFFVSPPPFFTLYAWLELLYHVPVSLWSLKALSSDNPQLPLVLLPYATQTLVTTATCIFDYTFWDTTFSHKMTLTSLYGPYLALSAFMLLDMYSRLSGVIQRAGTVGKEQNKKRI